MNTPTTQHFVCANGTPGAEIPTSYHPGSYAIFILPPPSDAVPEENDEKLQRCSGAAQGSKWKARVGDAKARVGDAKDLICTIWRRVSRRDRYKT